MENEVLKVLSEAAISGEYAGKPVHRSEMEKMSSSMKQLA